MEAKQITKRLTIRSNLHLGVIEQVLKEHLVNCEIWGDLDLSIEEYINIKNRIMDLFVHSPTALQIKDLFRKYPVTMVSDIINFVLFEFDNIDFWSSWANRFEATLASSNQTEIGKMVMRIFERYNFEIIEDGGYVYVTPILCQAGIPCSCFNKIFSILENTLNVPYFSTREFVGELRGYRSYLIDAPVERYFRLHTDRAIDLISGIREMMHSLGALSSFDDDSLPDFAGVETRIIKQYIEWRKENRYKKYGKRKSEQYFNPPKLIFDDCKGICLLLPRQVLRDDMIYKLKWQIAYDATKKANEFSQVYNTDGINYTIEKTVPVDIAGIYKIDVFNADDASKSLTRSWVINGINKDNPVLAFNESGLIMSQQFISRKGITVVFDSNKTIITDQQGIQELVSIDLPESWTNARAYKIYPAEKKACITINSNKEKLDIECKHNFDIDFVQYGTLFDEKFSSYEVPVFVRFPTIDIIGDIDEWPISTFDSWQISIIHRLSNTRHTVMLSEIGIRRKNDCYHLSLANYANELFYGLYGPYEIKIYDGKKRRDLSFYMSPTIDYSGIIEEIGDDIYKKKAGFYYKAAGTAEVEFEKSARVMPNLNRGAGWYLVTTESKGAFINGQIIFDFMGNKYRIPFRKTIRDMQWQFWNESHNYTENYGIKLFYNTQIKDEKWRLALYFTNKQHIDNPHKIVLESSSGEPLHSKELIMDRDGRCAININLFQDTIFAYKLPQKLMLYVTTGEHNLATVCLAIIRNFVALRNPKYSLQKERPILYWDEGYDLSGKKLKLVSLIDPDLQVFEYQLDKIQTFKGKYRDFQGIILDEVLPDGIYRIDAVENEEGFLFTDDTPSELNIYDAERVLYVNRKNILRAFIKKTDSSSLYEWLSAIILSLNNNELVNKISKKFRTQMEKQGFNFDLDKCINMLFVLILTTNDKSSLSNEIKELVISICEIISYWCVNNQDRFQILKRLIDINLSEQDINLIINTLQLYLFDSDISIRLDRRQMQKLWEVNENVAVLANIRRCSRNPSTDLLRIANYLNQDSFEQIVKFKPNIECTATEWLDCFEDVLTGKCINCDKVEFECSKRVWGDGFEWSGLFTQEKGDYKINPPTETHTDGYNIIGSNYLTLIYTLITGKNEELLSAEKAAMEDEFKVGNLISKYNYLFPFTHDVLKKRRGDGVGIDHKLFYLISAAAVLHALATAKKASSRDLKELLPFWKNVMSAFPKLVYRDLIVAELSLIFSAGRSR